VANPIMTDKAVAAAAAASRPGWGSPDPATRSTPINDGPVSSWTAGPAMTVTGTASASGVLLVLLLASAFVGWMRTTTSLTSEAQFPMLAIVGMFAGLGCAILLRFKPMWARFVAPLYAVAEGFFLGAISKVYDEAYDGIVVQAVGATLAVFAVMLVLYRTRIIKVTERYRRIVMMGTMGLMLFYVVSFVIRLFGGSVSYLTSATPLGILLSVVAAGLAASMLAVDFDMIERGAREAWPKNMEWYCAFGLLATLVWLYLEILRLLSKLQRR
jgi:uncharacterized YccA/Bax inhibitor family protein